MAKQTATLTSPSVVRAKLQAVLFYSRKKRIARQSSTP